MKESPKCNDSKDLMGQKEIVPGYVRTGILLLGSAIFGGIAVALWNRRTLVNMQNRSEEPVEKIPSMEDDAIY